MVSWIWLPAVAIFFFSIGYCWCSIIMTRIIAEMRVQHHKELRKKSVSDKLWTWFLDEKNRGKR